MYHPEIRRVSTAWLVLFMAAAAQWAICQQPLATGVASTATSVKPDAAATEFFESRVRPVLVKYCYDCHSQVTGKTMGGLSLDSRKGMMTGGRQGPAMVPGSTEGCKLLDAIRYRSADLQMPPSGKLPGAVVADIATWVKMGAPWPDARPSTQTNSHVVPGVTTIQQDRLRHWSWQPLKPIHLPAVKRTGWPKANIDRFILAKLESKSLTPGDYADRRTLIRRAYMDVIGLPPAQDEVDAFIADRSTDAWRRVVDRLLANPQYGERWGRFWLDLARYGEDQAHSFEPRLYPQGFRYRDWVADAFNSDMPYDKFLREQIAADVLNEPDREKQLPALGFFATGPVYYGDSKMLDQYDDRIDTMSRAMLGLTVACARCHDHKFDPIPQKDYYALAGVFASTNYIESPVAESPLGGAKTDPKSPGIANRNEAINKKANELDAFVAEHQKEFRSRYTPEIARYLVAAWRYKNRNVTVTDLTPASFSSTEKLEQTVLQRWIAYIDRTSIDDHGQAWITSLRTLVPAGKAKLDRSTDATTASAVQQAATNFQAAILEYSRRQDDNEVKKLKLAPISARERAALDEVTGSDGVLTLPRENFETLLTGDPKLRFGILSAELQRLKMGAFVHALTDAGKPIDLPVLVRGNPDAPGPVEPRHFLAILTESHGQPVPFNQGSGRLELANAIAGKSIPLAARVMVNRVWQHHFGVGLVRTASNFGMLGEAPSHPELLDYLTSRFITSGWSVKSLHREIMLSATYCLSSSMNARKFEIDPDDRLLWRMPRRRLEIEAWRDSMLAVSGTIDLTVGGPSLQLSSPDNRRRTFYAGVSRHDLDSMMKLFDFPDPNATTDARTSTTVPLQQLFVLNSEYMVRMAKAFAARINSSNAHTDTDRIRLAFSLAFNRTPDADELALARRFLASDRVPVTTQTVSGSEHTVNEAPTVQKPTGQTLTKWEQYAQVLLSSNEFMYVD